VVKKEKSRAIAANDSLMNACPVKLLVVDILFKETVHKATQRIGFFQLLWDEWEEAINSFTDGQKVNLASHA
jgi:hypothetical protein